MTLNDLKNSAAAYLATQPINFTVNGIDMFLLAVNNARQVAELSNNFNFTRKLLDLPVDGVVGARIDDAVEHYTQATNLNKPKEIIDVGMYDTDGNLRAVEWDTVSASLERQRKEIPYYGIRYPTDAQVASPPVSMRRFVFSGRSVYFYPKTTTIAPGTVFTIGFECYTFTPDWTILDLLTSPEPWTTKAWSYLLWSTVVNLNNIFKTFVFRQEGNLPSPVDQAQASLEALVSWDATMYNTFRRHAR